MAVPQSRGQLINFGLRKLGYPVLEINLDTDQIHDALDDTLQLYQERHYNGIERMYLKYKITQEDLDRGRAKGTDGVGIVTTTGISTNSAGTVSSNFYESSNFIAVPDHVIGVNKIFKFDTSSISGGMFSIKYQLFLNDLYYFNSVDLIGVEGTFNTTNNLRREGQSGAIVNLSSVPAAATNVYINKPHWTSTLDGGTF